MKIPLTKGRVLSYNYSRTKSANVAHLVERHLAKVEVASSSLVVRSNIAKRRYSAGAFLSDRPVFYSRRLFTNIWECDIILKFCELRLKREYRLWI